MLHAYTSYRLHYFSGCLGTDMGLLTLTITFSLASGQWIVTRHGLPLTSRLRVTILFTRLDLRPQLKILKIRSKLGGRAALQTPLQYWGRAAPRHSAIALRGYSGMSQTCPKHVQNMSQTCPKHVQNMSKTCPTHVQNMSNTCPKHVQHMSKTCPKHVQHILVIGYLVLVIGYWL